MQDTQSAPRKYLLELSEMTRTFPGVVANDKVSLGIRPGEIHALLGENGAGKSTLVKMIYGILAPDSGRLSWMGAETTVTSPAAARNLGIAMVFQHFSLFDSMSVLENIALGMDSEANTPDLAERIVEVSTRYGLPLDPQRHVYTLSVGERQRIEIIRCLLQEPRWLVMDEPTSVLTPQEVERLFGTLRRLSEEGVAILYISHKLDEIEALCEAATILRGGKVVDSVKVADESASSLAAKMMGQEIPPGKHERDTDIGEVRLEVQGLNLPANDPFDIPLKDVSFSVRSGEILGIAGVAGNGQDELLKALNGERTGKNNESVQFDGQSCGRLGPNPRRKLGLASIPEERLGHGAVPTMDLVDNTLLTAFQRMGFSASGFIRYAPCEDFCNAVIDRFKVKANGSSAQAGSLSGGNLQKFIVGREIDQKPSVLVVSQPTWGVDAGAAQSIHDALRDLANNGAAILVISQDLDELVKISDRLCAICAGEVSSIVETGSVSIEQIGLMMAGSRDAVAAQEEATS